MTTITELEAAHEQLDRGCPRWRLQAACAGIEDPDIFFADRRTTAHREALTLCLRCPVRRECLTDAIECGVQDGIRGGRTEEQLRQIVAFREGRQVDLDRVRATLFGTHRPRLTEAEKKAVVRVATEAGIPRDTWAALLGIGYKAATARRRQARIQLVVIPASMRREEIALAEELRDTTVLTPAVAA
ncbi:WhiB family transcriptional regulator [Kitasatospora sp. NPDC001119]